MKIRFVENWKSAWKWISVQAMILAGAIQTTWAMIPADMKASVSEEWVFRFTIALLVAGVVGRLVDQGSAK